MVRKAVTTAIRMEAVCSAPTWVRNAAISTIENGAGASAPGTAASKQLNARPSGTPGMTWWTRTPALPPMKRDGKMGPPTKPLPWLTAKVSILAIKIATTRPHTQVSRVEHGRELIAAREHRQWQCHADNPKITPPRVDFAIVGSCRTLHTKLRFSSSPALTTVKVLSSPVPVADRCRVLVSGVDRCGGPVARALLGRRTPAVRLATLRTHLIRD